MALDISGLVIRIIFLLLPGALASVLYRKLKGRTTRKDWEDVIEIIIFSLLSYIIYALVIYLLNLYGAWRGLEVIAFTSFYAFFDEAVKVQWHEVLFATLIGVLLSFIASFIYMKRLVNRFGQHIGVTNHFGEEDIWYFFHNVPDVQWVFIRDHKFDLAYRCWIEAYSDPYKERELLLRDADVYVNSTGEFLYQRKAIYLSRKHDELTIEVPLASNDTAGGEEGNENQSTDVERS